MVPNGQRCEIVWHSGQEISLYQLDKLWEEFQQEVHLLHKSRNAQCL